MARRKRGRPRKKSASNMLAYSVCAVVAAGALAVPVTRYVRAHQDVVITAAVLLAVAALIALAVIIWQRNRRREVAELRLREVYLYNEMGPTQFEHAVAALCERDGCRNVRVTGGAGDLGADVIATAPGGRKVVIQAKRYGVRRSVGSPDLQKFGGTCFTVHNADVAAVVTTAAKFSKQARGYAAHSNIRLLDNAALAAWASQTGPAPWH